MTDTNNMRLRIADEINRAPSEVIGENSLIGYSRPDGPEARKSQYRLTKVSDAAGTRSIMAKQ